VIPPAPPDHDGAVVVGDAASAPCASPPTEVVPWDEVIRIVRGGWGWRVGVLSERAGIRPVARRGQGNRPDDVPDSFRGTLKGIPDGAVFITVREAAVILDVPASSVYNAIRKGTFPVRRIGRYMRVAVSAVLAESDFEVGSGSRDKGHDDSKGPNKKRREVGSRTSLQVATGRAPYIETAIALLRKDGRGSPRT
jgi:excisionase family DNA binding protein